MCDADLDAERKSNSSQQGQLKSERGGEKTKDSRDSTAAAISSSHAPSAKNLGAPPASNSLAASVSKGSVNGSRVTMHSNLVPTETQDMSWSEIDTLDDVKKMAKEPIINDGFPLDFEDKLTQMRRSHAQLLRLMRERNQRLKCAQPKLSTKLESPTQKSRNGPATMNRGQGLDQLLDDPEIVRDGEKYVSQIVDTIKGLDR
ncbi:hypothetical protein SKDZ_02G3030 [Saccharomyces kudriavzevii ZP591]|uniref:YBR197C-like protein n=1 Tax=Saccharomyces cerevisiae x Saccharomyces kudriavzevii (strain VIN7) TaxID=1095631 RepID=H0GRI1_SACCK|nr:YBR197C-like protein [Saccharomyces cerevisiae x Saccharomyces kudriavzevii VIN7]CAI4055775.1 hypothetical protein SKDZ_02G3030 [Saccharomyces kudriavzevii ZP591]